MSVLRSPRQIPGQGLQTFGEGPVKGGEHCTELPLRRYTAIVTLRYRSSGYHLQRGYAGEFLPRASCVWSRGRGLVPIPTHSDKSGEVTMYTGASSSCAALASPSDLHFLGSLLLAFLTNWISCSMTGPHFLELLAAQCAQRILAVAADFVSVLVVVGVEVSQRQTPSSLVVNCISPY